jgi:hypothetical protein
VGSGRPRAPEARKGNLTGGGASVVNFTGSSCLDCHDKASAQWDLICGDPGGGNTHGCAPLPLTAATLTAFQESDPRCSDQ